MLVISMSASQYSSITLSSLWHNGKPLNKTQNLKISHPLPSLTMSPKIAGGSGKISSKVSVNTLEYQFTDIKISYTKAKQKKNAKKKKKQKKDNFRLLNHLLSVLLWAKYFGWELPAFRNMESTQPDRMRTENSCMHRPRVSNVNADKGQTDSARERCGPGGDCRGNLGSWWLSSCEEKGSEQPHCHCPCFLISLRDFSLPIFL